MRRLAGLALATVALAGCGTERSLAPPELRLQAIRTPLPATTAAPALIDPLAIPLDEVGPVACAEDPRTLLRDCFQMRSEAGNQPLHAVLVGARARLDGGADRASVLASVRSAYAAAAQRYDETYDTVVREAFADALDRLLERAGMRRLAALDEFS